MAKLENTFLPMDGFDMRKKDNNDIFSADPHPSSYYLGLEKKRKIEQSLSNLEKVRQAHLDYVRVYGRTWLYDS